MQGEKKICHHFQKGSCRFGDGCRNSHDIKQQNGQSQFSGSQGNFGNNQNNGNFNHNPNPNPNPHNQNPYQGRTHQGQQNSNPHHGSKPNNKMSICKFFLGSKGCSKGENCGFLHNYHQTLHHISRESIMESTIVGLAATCIY